MADDEDNVIPIDQAEIHRRFTKVKDQLIDAASNLVPTGTVEDDQAIELIAKAVEALHFDFFAELHKRYPPPV